ncbi:MAG: hypothetical protein HOD63_15165 [Bacteroidetes bacterium]|nr:hypothetical protein [Bacteroidota bacterium]MBT5530120.1 hypothetical protein [Cytophagia bacterium]MBT3801811.1 hypothetical protein [Bacteroidota bacterium]MBT3935143.1 hypothetical protein [Bacteroidota bacterium]MBT4339929.1 hypothetical protein [Bacteroidota bacterium]
MGIKFNWGTAIVLVILLFFGSMAARIIISYQHEINLVDEDYYTKELSYQDHIDKEQNASELAEKPEFSIDNNTLYLQFPTYFQSSKIEGSIHLYRPSDKHLDHHYRLKLNNNLTQAMSVENLQKGLYHIKLDWIADSVAYYINQDLQVN